MLQSKTARWSTGTALLCVVLLAVAWFFVVSPRRAEADQVQAAVLTQQQQNDQLRTTVEQLKAEFVQLPATRAKLTEIRSQLPPTEDIPGLLRTFEGLATGAGVKLLSFSPGTSLSLGANGAPTSATTAGAAVLTALPLTVTVSGEYFQVVTFLRQLQTGVPRAFLISGLQIAKPDSAAGGATDGTSDSTSGGTANSSVGGVKVTINARVFSMPTSATQAAPKAPSVAAAPPVVAGAAPTPSSTPASTPASTSTPTSTGAIALPRATGSSRW